MIEKFLKVYEEVNVIKVSKNGIPEYITEGIKEAYNPIPGKYYRSIYGDRLKCVNDNKYIMISKTPLVQGEFFSDLTKKQLYLFVSIEKSNGGGYGNLNED